MAGPASWGELQHNLRKVLRLQAQQESRIKAKQAEILRIQSEYANKLKPLKAEMEVLRGDLKMFQKMEAKIRGDIRRVADELRDKPDFEI